MTVIQPPSGQGYSDGERVMRTLDYEPISEIRGENGTCALHPDDRKYGTLAIGSQGSGKTSILHRMFYNDLLDPNAAQILFDPKTELSRACLEIIPPDCPKEVWYLDLGDPIFGMTPLRIKPGLDQRAFALEASAIAESIVSALLAINPGQIFQSSRRYLNHAVIGALAIARMHPALENGLFEHVHGLLLPKDYGTALRSLAAQACTKLGIAGTAFFYMHEFPGQLQIAPQKVAEQLDAPRNKIDGIVATEPLRRFFQHPHNISLEDLIAKRAILIVNGNMATIGTDNSQTCIHFIFQMLHRAMQGAMQMGETTRPRVALIADEAHYLLSSNVVKQLATHRAAGLDMTMGIQFLAQLGAGAESGSLTDEIRDGIENLLNTRFMFRVSKQQDADNLIRIAQALPSTMNQQDPDSRANRRISMETLINIQNYDCVCSCIANGGRASAFIGRTFPMPPPASEWADGHRWKMLKRVGPLPEGVVRNIADLTDPVKLIEALKQGGEDFDALEASAVGEAESRSKASGTTPAPAPPPAAEPAEESVEEEEPSNRVPVQRLFGGAVAPDSNFNSPALQAWGTVPGDGEQTGPVQGDAPKSIRDLALADRIVGLDKWDEKSPGDLSRPLPEDYAILRLLDRAGVLLTTLVGRACLPGRATSTLNQKVRKLYNAGLVAKADIDIKGRSKGESRLGSVLRLTAHGFRVGQAEGLIDPEKEWSIPDIGELAITVSHDQHVIAWITALTNLLNEDIVTNNWRTPRMRHGVIEPPTINVGRARRQLTPIDLQPPGSSYAFSGAFTPAGEKDRFHRLRPDASIEIRVAPVHLTFDVLLELNLKGKPSHNKPKFAAYDSFLLGWYREKPRYQHLHGRPVVLFLFTDEQDMRSNAEVADRMLDGRLGVMGTPLNEWYWPGREHIFFALEENVHYGSLRCFALPGLPPKIREALGTQEPLLGERTMLPIRMIPDRPDETPSGK